MKLSRDQVNTIIKNGQAQGISGQAVLDGLISRGYEPEGVDVNAAKAAIAEKTASTVEPKKEGIIKDTAKDFVGIGEDIATESQKRAENIQAIQTAMKNGEQGKLRSLLQTVGQLAGAGADAIGAVAKGAVKIVLPPSAEKKVKEVVGQFGQAIASRPEVQSVLKWYGELPPENQRDIDAAGGVISLVSNFLGGEVASKGGTLLKDATTAGLDVTKKAVGEGVTATSKAVKTATGALDTVLATPKKVLKEIAGPEVSDAAKVSLNPMEALKDTGQDILVSVKDAKGKPVLKKLSELLPEEKASVQAETKQNLDSFVKQAELFKNDRSVPEGSPVEIIGKRTDQALEVADKQRQAIGKQMGEIETKYLDNPLAINEKTLSEFSDVIKNFDNKKFGVDTGGGPVVRKLVEDFDALEQGGATVGERLQFVRDWQQYLRDSKDAFGNFKENASANMRIEKAVNTIKNETVDHISEVDKGYAGLRKQYAEHLKLQEIGDSLLGKEGAYGERVKGAATVKRAIQSNSDAGARQFLTKIKELTGYDAIKEGDIALTAMELVGDYQGLSLLNVLNEGKGGVAKRVLEKIRDLAVGSDKKRVEEYIKKLGTTK